MIIQNSEVQMASKSSYRTATKVEYQREFTPGFNLGNFTIEEPKAGQAVKGSQNLDSGSTSRQIRLNTMAYLIKMLLLGKILGEDSEFGQMLKSMFESSAGYIETTTLNYDYSESQEVSYSAVGTATTADGRSLHFNYGFQMSSSFHKEYQSTETGFVNYLDPLVINLNDLPTKIEDQTFYFDLDGDGTEEEISTLGKGAGFLALDKNEDGQINDGSELFGTKSGDGFGDLKIYDEDMNGWIDENDKIFEKLRVWTMNESGEMELYTLKESDVGAIYLGKAPTEFIDYNGEHQARAAMRETGIFLHESDGHAGSIQHVDFAT